MMTSRKFSLLALLIPMAIILAVGAANFLIDADSSRHLPTEHSLFPRTTNHSALSKLHFIAEQQPEVLYFGSSRVEVGLPVDTALFKTPSVYNAALSANTLGNTLPLIKHVMAGYTPKLIVLGVDFMSFTTKANPESNLDAALLSSSFSEYRFKRLLHDLKRAVTVDATSHTITSLRALAAGGRYDQITGPASVRGQTSEQEMLRLTATRGQYVQAFQRTLKYAASPPPGPADIQAGLLMFEEFIASACARKITVRVFSNPRHALGEYMLAKNGHWEAVAAWRSALADIASRYQGACDLKLFDFAGFNSVTAETIEGMSAAAGLANYWEASHYRETVGKLILKRMFAPDATLPADFGHDLNRASVADINRRDAAAREQYEAAHGKEIALANAWLTVDTSH
jgi:hypothetical protein